MKITKTNDKRIGLKLTPKHPKKNQNKNTKAKTKNKKCVGSKYKQIFIAMK
jgi:hypothetical protein